MNEEFTLTNVKPKPKPPAIEQAKERQNVLFSGLNCLPGQQDLFETDGKIRDEKENSSSSS
jgi:hypothetical protein